MKAKEKIEAGWIHCNAILEIAGKPADFVDKTLSAVLEKLAKEKETELVSNVPHKAIENRGVYTAFAEVELWVGSFRRLIELVFDYLLSSVEILEPKEVKINQQDASAVLSDLAGRLHRSDALAKAFALQSAILKKRLAEKEKGSESGERGGTKSK